MTENKTTDFIANELYCYLKTLPNYKKLSFEELREKAVFELFRTIYITAGNHPEMRFEPDFHAQMDFEVYKKVCKKLKEGKK